MLEFIIAIALVCSIIINLVQAGITNDLQNQIDSLDEVLGDYETELAVMSMRIVDLSKFSPKPKATKTKKQVKK